MLTTKGWACTFIIAIIIVLVGLSSFLIYPISFLLLGSIVSKLNPNNSDNSGRDSKQVLANAGVPTIVAIIYFFTQYEICRELFVLCWSVALSDTFSSEIGKRYGGLTIDILTFSSIPKGLSGGISTIGSLGGLIGSMVIGCLYYIQANDLKKSILVILFGFLGMFVDSLIGSRFQAKYSIEGNVIESGHKSNLISGYSVIDNCVTNFLSIAVMVILYLIFNSSNLQ
jgi:uncharacterized protein (TIGR00297 family)